MKKLKNHRGLKVPTFPKMGRKEKLTSKEEFPEFKKVRRKKFP